MWRIWIKYFDDEGRPCGMGYFWKFYVSKANAERAAKRLYPDTKKYSYIVAQSCPWRKVSNT